MEVEEVMAELAQLRRDLDSGKYYVKHGTQHRRGGRDPHGIVVEEADGSPSAKNVTKVIVSNTSLTDNQDGSVTLTTGTGGGGVGFAAPPATGSFDTAPGAGVLATALRSDAVFPLFEVSTPTDTAATATGGSSGFASRDTHQHRLGAHTHTSATGDGGALATGVSSLVAGAGITVSGSDAVTVAQTERIKHFEISFGQTVGTGYQV